MKEVVIKQDSLNYCSLEDILKNIDNYNFDKITLDNYYEFEKDNESYRVYMTDKNIPVCFGKTILSHTINSIVIDPEYYNQNKEYVDNMLFSIINKSNNEYIHIEGNSLINTRIKQAIIDNKNISNVYLTGLPSENYSLTQEDYEKFKESGHISNVKTKAIDKELEDNFDTIIDYNANKSLMFNLRYKDIIEADKITIGKTINEESKKDLKYINLIPDDCIIEYRSENYDLLKNLLISLKDNNKNNLVKIHVKNKNKFNKLVFDNLDIFLESRSNVIFPIDYVNIKKYVEYEKRLYEMIKPAINLSPLEKYLYAYNIVKKYKPYKEDLNNKASARHLYDVLDSESMVCVGYANLLEDLLEKLNINSSTINESVNASFDENEEDLEIANDIETKHSGHERVCVYLNDKKYNIKGFYYADPTWDNSMEHDAYNYALMTQKEYDSMHRENYYSKPTDILIDSFSLDEFYTKVNYLLNKNPEKGVKDLIFNIYLFIEKINPELADETYACYENNKRTENDISEILSKIGNFIVNNNNNRVDAQTLFEAIAVVYKTNGMTKEEIFSKLPEVIRYNAKQHSKCFPKRQIIRVDSKTKEDIKEDYMNENNKFDTNIDLNMDRNAK